MRAVMTISALGRLTSHQGLKTSLRTRLTTHQRHREKRGQLVTDSMEKGGNNPALFCCPPASKRHTEKNHPQPRTRFPGSLLNLSTRSEATRKFRYSGPSNLANTASAALPKDVRVVNLQNSMRIPQCPPSSINRPASIS